MKTKRRKEGVYEGWRHKWDMWLYQGSADTSLKGQVINILGLWAYGLSQPLSSTLAQIILKLMGVAVF